MDFCCFSLCLDFSKKIIKKMGQKLGNNRCPLFTMLTKQNSSMFCIVCKENKRKIISLSWATCPHTHTDLFSRATCPQMLNVVYFQGRPAHTLTVVYFQGRPAHTLTLVCFHGRPALLLGLPEIPSSDRTRTKIGV